LIYTILPVKVEGFVAVVFFICQNTVELNILDYGLLPAQSRELCLVYSEQYYALQSFHEFIICAFFIVID